MWSDKLFSKSTYEKSPLKIIPFRGEYLKFKEEFNEVINHLVYPVPDSNFPFLGVHFSRMIDGSKELDQMYFAAKKTVIQIQVFVLMH